MNFLIILFLLFGIEFFIRETKYRGKTNEQITAIKEERAGKIKRFFFLFLIPLILLWLWFYFIYVTFC